MIYWIYISILILNFICTFINFSNGALFTDGTKGLATIIYWIILIIFIILLSINYSLTHILLIPIISYLSGCIFSKILLNTIFKR